MKKILNISGLTALLTPQLARAETIVLQKNGPTIQEFSMNFLYGTVLPVLGVLALGSLVWGGVTIMTAGGDDTKVSRGRSILTFAIVGIVLILCSYGIIIWLNNAIVDAIK